MTNAKHDCAGCPVSAGTHKPADAVHQIGEPATELTDQQIDEVFARMPDGAQGFLKSWGYRQFAREIAALATPSPAVPASGFELWWADHTPESTQEQAWAAWVALYRDSAEPAPQAALAAVPKILGWVRRAHDGRIGNHFYTYEPHCDTTIREDGGEKVAVVAAPAHPAEGVPAPVVVQLPEATVVAEVSNKGASAWDVQFTWPVGRFEENGAHKLYTEAQLREAMASAALAATPAAPASVVLPEHVRDALEDAESVLNSINKGKQHAVTVDDEVCYWQRKEWIDWAEKDVLPKVRAALAAPAAGVPAAAPDARRLIGKDHKGTRVDYSGMLGQVQREIKRSAPGYAEMIRQLKGHLQELGQGWYAGNTGVVDEFLQLYCVESEARAAIAAQVNGEQA